MLSCILLVLLAAAAVASAASASERRSAKKVDIANLQQASAPFRDTILRSVPGRHFLESTLTPYATVDGLTVYVAFSDSYTPDPVVAQTYVDLFAQLLHGSELNGLQVHIETPLEIAGSCSAASVACYFPVGGHMYVPGEDSAGIPVEQVLTHEYGHRVAAYRSNSPWLAFDWGTKRWASYMNVCYHVFGPRDWFPGDEGSHYRQNPGEGFAEAYRRLNELRNAWAPFPWQIVDPLFSPNQAALSLLARDVTNPWTAPTAYRRTGRLRPHGVRRYQLPVWDGRVTAGVSAPRGASVSFATHGRRWAGPARRISGVTCGDRSITVTVSSRRGGRYVLKVTRPTG